MKVILLKELKELKGKGSEGDVVDVAPGFANNYLIPQKVAKPVAKGNLKQLERAASRARVEDLLNDEQAKLDALGGRHGIVWDARNQTDLDTDVFKDYEVDGLNKSLDVIDGIRDACEAFGTSAVKGDDGRWHCSDNEGGE